ncbi:MAG: FecR domain-containing protein [Gammaproteobacteria bacterium]
MTQLTRLRLNFLVFFGLILFAFCQLSYAADAAVVGQMVWVSGSVQAVSADNQTRVLQRRSPIYEADTIKTSSGGSGQIVFTDSSVVALRSDTTFRIDQYKYTNPQSQDNKYVATVAKGGFRTITGFITKANPDAYEVHTPVATIGVRGTDYSIFYGSSRGLSVKLDRGAILVSNKAGQIELNAARNRIYAEISGLNVKPAITTTPAPVFRSQPGVSSASFKPSAGGGSSGVSTTTTTVTTPTPKSTSTTRQPISTGPAKSVSGFCIN